MVEMAEDGIDLILAKASDLRSKITNCIDMSPKGALPFLTASQGLNHAEETRIYDEDTHTLFKISDALESLESQLSSLQALCQHQRYERDAALGEIDYYRKNLLKKLKEYKREDLDVIREASAFASESVQQNDSLLLPPHHNRPPCSLVLENGCSPHFSSPNGALSDPSDDTKKGVNGTDLSRIPSAPKNTWRGLRLRGGSTTKIVLTLVSVAAFLSLSIFQLRRKGSHVKISGLRQLPANRNNSSTGECLPGKLLVVEGRKPIPCEGMG